MSCLTWTPGSPTLPPPQSIPPTSHSWCSDWLTPHPSGARVQHIIQGRPPQSVLAISALHSLYTQYLFIPLISPHCKMGWIFCLALRCHGQGPCLCCSLSYFPNRAQCLELFHKDIWVDGLMDEWMDGRQEGRERSTDTASLIEEKKVWRQSWVGSHVCWVIAEIQNHWIYGAPAP